MTKHDSVRAADAVLALAVAGDLAMGQPPGHSQRTAALAMRVAQADGADAIGIDAARRVALLRWSGAAASAPGFNALLGDDVAGRRAMLARTLAAGHPLTPANVAPLAQAHCEVASDVARALGQRREVVTALCCAFEHADGGGTPAGLVEEDIPPVVFHVALAGDLEALCRAHGLETALRLVGRLANRKYPRALVAAVLPHARRWLAEGDHASLDDALEVPLALVADVLELKLPFLAGHARRVERLVRRSSVALALPAAQADCLAHAALLHGFGRAAVPNAIWERDGKLRPADWEQVRRMPYWTGRLGEHVPALAGTALLASHAFERLDGSGYFRRLTGDAMDDGHRLLAAATAWTALRSPRPWRPAHQRASAVALLTAQDARFDRHAVDAVVAADAVLAPRPAGPLTVREVEVLGEVLKHGATRTGMREAARKLRISVPQVHAHIDSILDQLGCRTLPAAVLKTAALGLL